MSSVDVFIPCYRYGRFLRECVRSVLTQGVTPVRVLILDDASPDETPAVAAALASEDDRVTYRRHATNAGHIATYNEGIEWAEADYLLLLSADDVLLPGALDRAVALLDAHPSMTVCFGDAVGLAANGARTPLRMPMHRATIGGHAVLSGEQFVDECIGQGTDNFVTTATAVVRTSVQKRVGGYRAELPHTADLELWLRLAAHGPVGYLRADQAIYRRHDANMSLGYVDEHILRDLHQRKAALDVFAESCRAQVHNMPVVHRRLLRALARNALGQASTAFNRGNKKLSLEVSAFAASLHPGARRSLPWSSLVVKRGLGIRLSRTLLPAAAAMRQFGERLRG